MDVFDLLAKLTLDTSEYEEGLSGAQEKAGSFGGKIGQTLGTAGKVGAAALVGVTTATVAMGTAVVKSAGQTAAYGDNIDKMSQKMNMSAEAYQEWDAILQHSGTSMESMQSGMKTLANAVENGNAAFERLGMTQEEIASMSQEELFGATITALQNVESETERTYLAGQLLGKGATELGALLNSTAEETEEMRQRVHELGGVMSDEAVKAAAKYQDSLQDMQTASQALTRNLSTEFLPGITSVMDGLAEVFIGNGESGLGMISKGIDQLISSLTEQLPKFVEMGANILVTLAEGIAKNLPKLAEVSVKIITMLANGLAEKLPQLMETAAEMITQLVSALTNPETLNGLLEAGLKIITALADGLMKAIPKLLEALPELVHNIIAFLVSAIPEFIQAGFDLFTALVQDLPNIITSIAMVLPDLITGIVTGLLDGIPMMIEAGIELLSSIVSDLPQIIANIVQAVPKIIAGLAEGFVNNAGKLIESGLKLIGSLIEGLIQAIPLILEVGPKIVQGLAEGIIGSLKIIADAGKKIVDKIKDAIKEAVNAAKQWGADLIRNFTDGIKSKLSGLWSTVTGIASKIKNLLGFSEPKEGPLSDFHTYAPDMMKLFAKGIRDNEHLITDQIKSSFDFGRATVSGGAGMATGNTTNTYNIVVNGIEELEDMLRWYESRQVRARMA